MTHTHMFSYKKINSSEDTVQTKFNEILNLAVTMTTATDLQGILACDDVALNKV